MKNLLIIIFMFIAYISNAQIDTILITLDIGSFTSNGTYQVSSKPDKAVNGKFILVRTIVDIQVKQDTVFIEPKKANFKKY